MYISKQPTLTQASVIGSTARTRDLYVSYSCSWGVFELVVIIQGARMDKCHANKKDAYQCPCLLLWWPFSRLFIG